MRITSVPEEPDALQAGEIATRIIGRFVPTAARAGCTIQASLAIDADVPARVVPPLMPRIIAQRTAETLLNRRMKQEVATMTRALIQGYAAWERGSSEVRGPGFGVSTGVHSSPEPRTSNSSPSQSACTHIEHICYPAPTAWGTERKGGVWTRSARQHWSNFGTRSRAISAVVQGLSDDALNWRPGPETNSIAVLVAHAWGAAQDMDVAGGGTEIERDREAEFHVVLSGAECEALIRQAMARVTTFVEAIDPATYGDDRVDRGRRSLHRRALPDPRGRAHAGASRPRGTDPAMWAASGRRPRRAPCPRRVTWNATMYVSDVCVWSREGKTDEADG